MLLGMLAYFMKYGKEQRNKKLVALLYGTVIGKMIFFYVILSCLVMNVNFNYGLVWVYNLETLERRTQKTMLLPVPTVQY